MQAILMTEPGLPEVLKIQDIPAPTLEKPNQALIKIRAAGVNPIDTKIRRRGTFYPDQMPAVLGSMERELSKRSLGRKERESILPPIPSGEKSFSTPSPP